MLKQQEEQTLVEEQLLEQDQQVEKRQQQMQTQEVCDMFFSTISFDETLLEYSGCAGVGGWLDPLDGWTPGPNILGQMDRGSNSPTGCLDSPLEEWTPPTQPRGKVNVSSCSLSVVSACSCDGGLSRSFLFFK